eukprot:COSAG01_NODE_8119_length_2867_cov_8.576199_2_plen_153_part_00
MPGAGGGGVFGGGGGGGQRGFGAGRFELPPPPLWPMAMTGRPLNWCPFSHQSYLQPRAVGVEELAGGHPCVERSLQRVLHAVVLTAAVASQYFLTHGVLDKNRRHIGRSQSKRPHKRTQRLPHQQLHLHAREAQHVLDEAQAHARLCDAMVR